MTVLLIYKKLNLYMFLLDEPNQKASQTSIVRASFARSYAENSDIESPGGAFVNEAE
jgi:hypothetical protein